MTASEPHRPEAPVSGVAAGVPYAARPPDGPGERAPVILLWHGFDPPRSPTALAAALPLHGLPAWRVYLTLPMFGERAPGGDMEAAMRLGAEDFLMKLYAPVVEQAVAELPAVLEELRAQLPVSAGPVGLAGFSAGGAATLLALAESPVPVATAAVINATPDAAHLVAEGEKVYGVTYPWTEEARAKARQLDFVARGADVAARDPQPAILFTAGGRDPLGDDARAAHAAAQRHYADPERVGFQLFSDLDHAFVPEPGVGPAPQSPESAQVDEAVTAWFRRHPFAWLG